MDCTNFSHSIQKTLIGGDGSFVKGGAWERAILNRLVPIHHVETGGAHSSGSKVFVIPNFNIEFQVFSSLSSTISHSDSVYGDEDFHKKLQEDHAFAYDFIKENFRSLEAESNSAGTEIRADVNGGALASTAEEKPNEEFGVSGV
ncbi:hypothetical protein C0J52_01625 [Blattella germanica]|nr:hypothetical protein C0J52_01625 [Blattella germanica]